MLIVDPGTAAPDVEFEPHDNVTSENDLQHLFTKNLHKILPHFLKIHDTHAAQAVPFYPTAVESGHANTFRCDLTITAKPIEYHCVCFSVCLVELKFSIKQPAELKIALAQLAEYARSVFRAGRLFERSTIFGIVADKTRFHFVRITLALPKIIVVFSDEKGYTAENIIQLRNFLHSSQLFSNVNIPANFIYVKGFQDVSFSRELVDRLLENEVAATFSPSADTRVESQRNSKRPKLEGTEQRPICCDIVEVICRRWILGFGADAGGRLEVPFPALIYSSSISSVFTCDSYIVKVNPLGFHQGFFEREAMIYRRIKRLRIEGTLELVASRTTQSSVFLLARPFAKADSKDIGSIYKVVPVLERLHKECHIVHGASANGYEMNFHVYTLYMRK